MGRETRDLLRYMESVAFAMFVLRQLGPEEVEAANLGTAEACEQLAVLPVGSAAAWAWLARVCRHLTVICEEKQDRRLVIAQQLSADVQRRADAAALAAGPHKEA